jgi:hypothetical protein
MVAEAPHDQDVHTPSGAHARRPRREGARGVRHLVASTAKLCGLQYRIWLTRAKITALKIAVFAGLFMSAMLLGILAAIFLAIGIFRVLTDVLHIPVWASFLIFGGLLALLAIVLVSIGVAKITRGAADHDKEAGG